MIVSGGFYREVCTSLQRDEQLGSGGRAAMAIASAGVHVNWHYYCPESHQEAARIGLFHPNLEHTAHTSDKLITFDYFHPLSTPIYSPENPKQHSPIHIEGENVLCFGFMEGAAVVHGKNVVYDPQSPNNPNSYRDNGSTATSLAIILNIDEIRSFTGLDDESQAVKQITKTENAKVVIVKLGPQGCNVYIQGVYKGAVPAYSSERVYKIGSGDIFSAAFAYYWAELDLSPFEAAENASRCVARYVSTRILSVELDKQTNDLKPLAVKNIDAQVYIAGPFFTISQLWLIEEACRTLHNLGVKFFSPYHEVGLLPDYQCESRDCARVQEVVKRDLEGLRNSAAVFAILDECDPGTLFEIGWAVRHGIPVVALSQRPKPGDQTMIYGSDLCSISDDFASAIHQVAWAAWTR